MKKEVPPLDPILLNIVRVIARKEAQRDLDRGVTINDLMREYEQCTDTRTIEELPRFTPATPQTSKKTDRLTIKWRFVGNTPNETG